jgi:hypothetical protein
MDELERLPAGFRIELTKIYADNKPFRREYILGATARLRAKYNQKLMSLRAIAPPDMVDATEAAIVEIENEFAAQLAA